MGFIAKRNDISEAKMDRMAALGVNPSAVSLDINDILEGVEVCFSCAQNCTICADAYLVENQIETYRAIIRMCLKCSDVCETTGEMLASFNRIDGDLIRNQLQVCTSVCRVCAETCETLSRNLILCDGCAESCRQTQDVCSRLLEYY